MSSRYERYRNLDGAGAPPQRNRIWQLTAAGLENLALNDVPVEPPGDDQVLVRCDAVGICASDVKMTAQGAGHARMKGMDLKATPTTPGHEFCLTVVAAGARYAGRLPVGRRITLQPDIYIDGVPHSIGYRIPGCLAEYRTFGPEVLEAYLIEIDQSLGFSQVALAEPWACVYWAYEGHRGSQSVLPGGVTWMIGAGPLAQMHIEKAIVARPKRVVVSEIKADRLQRVRRTLGPVAERHGVELVTINTAERSVGEVLAPRSVDDCVLLAPVAAAAEEALAYLKRGAFFNVFAGFPDRDKAWLRVNLNDMHYQDWTLLATSGSPISAMVQAMADTAAGGINPDNAVAAVGGLAAGRDAIEATKLGTYPGRIVIYPHIELPLTAVEALTEDGVWSADAERALLDRLLGESG
jgi:threonine dehydrogenase-like Zn-dependent dehydrogenase